MKKIYGFAFASAIMALASCSNDSEPVVDQPIVDGGEIAGYIAVNISNPAGTRSSNDVTDGGYELGSGDENTITNAKFIVFAKNTQGKYEVSYVVDKTTTETDWVGPADFPNTVEMIGGTTLVIPQSATGNPTTGADNADVAPDMKLLVVLNYDGSINVGETLDGVKGKIVTVAGDLHNKGSKFVMSNSSYTDNGKVVCEVTLDPAYLMQTPTQATNNPIDVYVERVVARADYTLATSATYTNNDIIWDGNSTKTETLKPVVKAAYFYNNPSNARLFKDATSTSWNTNWVGVNDVANHRSYWATMPSTGIDQEANTSITFNGALTDNAWAGAETKRYINENTFGSANKKQTMLVVLAQLEGEDNKPVTDMANIFGQFTTKAGAINLVANTLHGLGYRVVTKDAQDKITSVRDIKATELKWSGKAVAAVADATATNPGYKVGEGDGNRTYLQSNFDLKANESLAKIDGVVTEENEEGETVATEVVNYQAVDSDDIDALLKKDYAISVWENGYCYYYVDVNHLKFGVTTDGYTNPGVVRNHVYDININGISGLGTPVFDPSHVIIPTDPEYNNNKEVYLAATINVLRWKVVKNDVILGQ